MNLEVSSKQFQALTYLGDTTTDEIIYGGGAGGGKSWLGCLWLIDRCTRYPGSRWVMSREKLKTLKETTLVTFQDLATKLKVAYVYNENSHTIKFPNGSVILLKELFFYPRDPEYDSLGSLEICGAFVDEVTQIVKKAWTVLKSRCRYKLDEFGLTPKMLGSCNPGKNWVYYDFFKPWKEGLLKAGRAFVQALVGDNKHLPKSYIKTLQSLDKASRERLLNGNWEYDDDPSTLCSFDAINDLWTNEGAEEGEWFITADIALQGSDKLVIGVWNGWHLKRIIGRDKSTAPEVVELITKLAKQYKVRRSNIVFDNDGVGAFLSGYLKGARPFKNGSRPMKNEKYKNLKCQCEYKLADYINEGLIRIHPDKYREPLVEELEQLKSHNSEKDSPLETLPKEKVKSIIGRSPDFRDMMAMRMYFTLIPRSSFKASMV